MLVILIRPFGRVRLKGGLPLYLSFVREGIICRFPSPNPRVRSTQVREASPSGVNDASALNCTALRRFRRGGFLGAGLKAPIVPPIHAKSAQSARPSVSRVQMSVWCLVPMYIPPSVQTDKWCVGVGNAPFVLYAGRLSSATAPTGGRKGDVFCCSG